MKILLTYLFILIAISANACDCKFNGGFLKTAYQSDYVLKIKIQKKLKMVSEFDNEYFDNGILVKIEDIIKGSIKSDTISIFITSPFINCGPNLDDFTVDSEWIIAINRNKADGRLVFSLCLLDYLKLNNNIATGLITINTKCEQKMESFGYNYIKGMIKTPSRYLQASKDCQNKDYYLWVNNMPKPQIGYDSLESIIYSEFKLEDAVFDKCQYIVFNISIDTLGKITKIETASNCLSIKSNSVDYRSKSLNIIKNRVTWVAGNHFGKKMNVSINYKIDFTEIKSRKYRYKKKKS